MSSGKRYLVTGGGGFLGGAIVSELRRHGAEVISLARGHYPELQAAGVEQLRHDLGNGDEHELTAALGRVDGIFHVAGHVRLWGPWDTFYRVNVLGTRKLLAAAARAGVRNFVFTSSPSVIGDGRDLSGVDESYPYPQNYLANYPKSKALAEREVLAANRVELQTLALRPHLIFGPGDNNFVPTILAKARSRAVTQVGEGRNLVDLTFVEDAAAAHIAAMNTLEQDPRRAAGRAYFISQGEPVNFWAWINEVLERNGLPRVRRKIPVGVAYQIASLCEAIARILPGNPEPPFTRFLVKEMSTDHYFNISAARDLLGYAPKRSISEAMQITFPGTPEAPWLRSSEARH